MTMPDRGAPRVLVPLVLLLTGIVYVGGVSGPWLFDDAPNLVENPHLYIDGTAFDDWRTAALSSDSGPLRRPLAMASFAAQHAVTGALTPGLSKAINIALHCVTGLLVYAVTRRLLRAPALDPLPGGIAQLVALTAAAIWLWHPLHVSTVLYAVQRMAQLATLFTLFGLCFYLQRRLEWLEKMPRWDDLLAMSLWLLLIMITAALCKENGLLLPVLIMVVEASLFRGRWGGRNIRSMSVLAWTGTIMVPAALAALYFFSSLARIN